MNVHATGFANDKAIWSDATVEVLISMLAAGRSSRDIASAIGTTRNAVIGKANRLRAQGLVPTYERSPAQKPGGVASPRSREKKKAAVVVASVPRVTQGIQIRPLLGSSEITTVGMPVAEVMGRAGRCKYGLWGVRDYPELENKLVCAQPAIPGKSWCRHCYKLVYSPREQRARRRAA
ncbi:GcrA family cell cycle regulator [Chelatococcus sp. YT9]|uniref:GcrA family cell cycle regulator n=1 Tax=Chelatococcus sp. YT9 TaxID=2835635 RepID=UPI001BCDD832|nr:hypothetical protein [Chelatococcus sp. YT9]